MVSVYKPKPYTIDKTQAKATAKAMFEIQGLSHDEISLKTGFSKSIIKQWSYKEKWMENRALLVPKVEELTRQKFLELASAQGLPPERAISALIEGLTQANKDYVVGEKNGKIETLFEGKPDFAVRQKYLNTYMQVSGLIGNNVGNSGINVNGEGTVNVQINMPSKATSNKSKDV